MGCDGPSTEWGGGGQFDPHFLTASEDPIRAKILQFQSFILFKGTISYHPEKNWPSYQYFCQMRHFFQYGHTSVNY